MIRPIPSGRSGGRLGVLTGSRLDACNGTVVTMTEPADVVAGDADRFSLNIERISIGDRGDGHTLGGVGSVTVIVGANNVGKTTVLTQIREMLMQPNQLTRTSGPRVVTQLVPRWTGGQDDAEAWVRAYATIGTNERGDTAHRPRLQSEDIRQLRSVVNAAGPGRLINWFVNHLPVSGRIGLDNAGRLPKAADPPSHPLHVLHVDRKKLGELKRVMKKLFGFDLFLDTVGQNFFLRIGEPGVPAYTVDSYDSAYDDAVAALPDVQTQGDGIRAALRLLVDLITSMHSLVLVDEPEAFLHPPQARVIGREIGKQSKGQRSQVILATHDKNILQGVIESGTPVTILHLTRNENDTSADLLPPDKVAELWKDPRLRYTNALDGLFHSAVIIAESEQDAHFYQAAIDHVRSPSDACDEAEMPEHNLMFLGSNGKTNMPRIVRSLHDLGVKTVSTPDLDILNNPNVIRSLVEAHGGNWEDLEDDYRKATAEFRNVPNAPSRAEVKANLLALIDADNEAKLTEPLATAIAKAVKIPTTRWSDLKSGIVAFRSEKAAATSLINKLDALGIVLVKVGELENFVTTATAPKGPEFLTVAFGENSHTHPAAVEHAQRLLKAANIN
jgi:AAA domain, putative AbiEii toxin, Type IV TA system